MAKHEYVDITGLDRARVLQALYLHAGPAGLGAVQMFIGYLEGEPDFLTIEEAEDTLKNCRSYSSVNVDYLRGRRMKLCFEDRRPNRLWVVYYDQCSSRKARDVIAELHAEAGHGA